VDSFFSRFRWNNLSIRFKTGVVFVAQLMLIMVMAGAGFVALGSVRTAVETTLLRVVEARTLAKDLELQVQKLEQLRIELLTDSANPDFDPATSTIVSEFGNQVLALKTGMGDLQVLRSQVSGSVPDEATTTTFNDFNLHLNDSQDRFVEMFQIIQQLTNKTDGAVPQLRAAGDEVTFVALLSGDTSASSQATQIRNLEASFIANHSADSLQSLLTAVQGFEDSYPSAVPPEIQGRKNQALTQYRDNINNTARLFRQLDSSNNDTASQIGTLRDNGTRLINLIAAQTNSPLDTVSAVLGQASLVLIGGLVLVVVAGTIVTLMFSRNLSRTIGQLVTSAKQLESGNFRARAVVLGTDEFSQIGTAINAMSSQIEGLISGLEQRVAERTRDLSITADIGRAVVQLRDPRELMNETVELIRQRFGYYHAQIFLVDDSRERAVLVASTGMAGRELLSRGHYLEVGSQSVIGQVTAKGDPLIASDTDVSGVHQRNELLPDTRSEMALPIRIGDRIIGALDVQSVAPSAFPEDVVAVFQTMADQLAIALESARAASQLQEAQFNLETMQRRLTRDAWQAYEQSRTADAPAAFALVNDTIQPHTSAAPFALQEAMNSGQPITLGNGGDELAELAIPIKVRGEIIGAFGFSGEALQNLGEDDIALVQAVIDRVGLALENIRLVEQTTRRAEHEQIVNEITAKIVGSTDVNFILQTTVKELGRVLRAPQTSVQLRRDKAG